MNRFSYIVNLRNSLKEQFRHMPLIQNGSAIIVRNNNGEILLQKRADRDMWGLPGGCQELGETFEETAIRELKEETNLDVCKDDLIFISLISGKSRYNIYPNGDKVYNNTALYLVEYNGGEIRYDFESNGMKFTDIMNLPINLIDKDLIEVFKKSNLK